MNTETSASSVIDRIVERNNALWALMTDNTLTPEQQLACIEKAFGPSPSSDTGAKR
jgi:hypothetical protein